MQPIARFLKLAHAIREPIIHKKREHVLIVGYGKDQVSATHLAYLPTTQEITIKKHRHYDTNKPDSLAQYVTRLSALENFKIIVGLESGMGRTIQSSAILIRKSPKEDIDEAELDDLVANAIWKIFDRERLQSARALNVSDVDVLLGDVKAVAVKLDGHRVINPVGFKAKSVEIILRQTYMPRLVYDALRRSIPFSKVALLEEAGVSFLQPLISSMRLPPNTPFSLAHIDQEKVRIFDVHNLYIHPATVASCGFNHFVNTCSSLYSFHPESFLNILNFSYGFSEDIKFKKAMRRHIGEWGNELRDVLDQQMSGDQKSQRLLFTISGLHDDFFKDASQKINAQFININRDFISRNFNFQIFPKAGTIDSEVMLACFLLFDWLSLPSVPFASKIVYRRVNWLVSGMHQQH